MRLLRDERAGLVTAVAGTAAAVALMAPFEDDIGLLNVGLALLLLTLLISSTWGWRVGLFAALVTNLSLNFFFVQPLHTFTVHDRSQIGALFVFLAVSIVGGSLLSRAQAAARTARRREAETAVLLGLSRELIGRADPAEALATLCEAVVRALRAGSAAVLSPAGAAWNVIAAAGGEQARRDLSRPESLLAGRVLASGSIGRLGATGHPGRRPLRVIGPGHRAVEEGEGVAFVPLRIGERPLGVLRIDGPFGDTPFRDRPDELLSAFAREAALGVQRVELAQQAAHAEALRQADEMKTALLASVSHDLKTPLAGIKASVSSLLDASVSWSADDVQSFLGLIDSQADRLDRVISDILDLNRIESGVVAPVRRTIDIRTLLEEAVERTRAVTADRRVTVDAHEGLVIESDEALLANALVNLLENAAKYSRPGGAIRLSASASPRGVEITVEDDGPGIAPEEIPHLFERFYRGASRGRAKGSGLGLAIVKGFVTLVGGTVRVESSAAGTRFVIALPSAQETGAA